MRAGLILAATLAALGARAETSAVHSVSNDPLMKAILSRQLTATGGGVTGAVRIGSGQTIAIAAEDALSPLKPAAGLAAEPEDEAKPAKKAARKARKPVKKASEQLERVAGDGRKADWR